MGKAAVSTGRISPRTWQYSGVACLTLVVVVVSPAAATTVADVMIAPAVGRPMSPAGIVMPVSDAHGTLGVSCPSWLRLTNTSPPPHAATPIPIAAARRARGNTNFIVLSPVVESTLGFSGESLGSGPPRRKARFRQGWY